ncbi:MAG: hypothetical protein ACFFFK_08625 [Candidatus Thorarchaeota archaeon]
MNENTSWKGVIKAGGLSFLLGGIIFFGFILSVFVYQVPLPLDAQGYLNTSFISSLLFSLAAFGEFLLLPGVLAIYFVLRDTNMNQAFLGTAIWITAIPMFLVSRGLVISLANIAENYAASADATLRTAYLVAIQLALDASGVFVTIALVLLGVGGIFLGFVMAKSVFGKPTGFLVILAGALTAMGTLGVILEPLTIGTLFGLILNGFWQVILGVKLIKLGREKPSL